MLYEGKTVLKGIAMGRIYIYKKADQAVKRIQIEDENAEVERYESAIAAVNGNLSKLYEKAIDEVGDSNAAIFEVYQMMLNDSVYKELVINLICSQKVNAEYAIATIYGGFAAMEDEYIKSRVSDIKDISNRVIMELQGITDTRLDSEEPVIVLAKELAPAELVQIDKSLLLSLVTQYGSINSHAAILAKTMNIPAIVGVEFDDDIDGHFAIVDGYNGSLYVDPSDDTIEFYKKRQLEVEEKLRLLKELKGLPNRTQDGREINLYANIDRPDDVAAVLENDAEGIGLFRSEFLYLESDTFPSEEEQYIAYKTVVEAMGDKKVVIRTLDIGADKQAGYFNLDSEENPAMGYRAIRLCLEHTDIFTTQLKAIFRASYYGNVSVMFPMITSVSEVHRIKEIISKVKNELSEQGIPYGDVEIGIMIETPAAVWMTEELAKEVDFFSIGTNDLAQYMLAVDRQNPRVEKFYDAYHPAVLKAIQLTVENGHRNGIRVGICGELGADKNMTETFVKMGVDELSVIPSRILPIRKRIRSI